MGSSQLSSDTFVLGEIDLNTLIFGESSLVGEAYLDVDVFGVGRIYTKTIYTGDLCSQKQALEYLIHLRERGCVSEKEFLKVQEQIKESALADG